MEFASILDNLTRRAPEEGSGLPGHGAADFWRVLDGLERNAAVDGRASRAAYRVNASGPEPVSEPVPSSVDPDDIAFELALSAATSLEDLKTARRLFARANHPDRATGGPERERANRRMTIANALIDEAAARFPR